MTAGTVQRFSLGFRGPLCLVCGFTGVSPQLFASGVAVGTVGTMALQIAAVRLHSCSVMQQTSLAPSRMMCVGHPRLGLLIWVGQLSCACSELAALLPAWQLCLPAVLEEAVSESSECSSGRLTGPKCVLCRATC